MRDLKEDMYDSDIWFGMPGLGDRKIWRQRRDSGRRHKVTRYNCHDCTNTNITKIRVTRLHKRPRMSGDGWILCWKSFILSVESVTIGCGYDLDIYSVSSTSSYGSQPASSAPCQKRQENLLRFLLLLMLMMRMVLATVCCRFGSWGLAKKLKKNSDIE